MDSRIRRWLLFLGILAFLFVTERIWVYQMGYTLETLEQRYRAVQERYRQLLSEAGRLAALERVERKARALGLVKPREHQVVLIPLRPGKPGEALAGGPLLEQPGRSEGAHAPAPGR